MRRWQDASAKVAMRSRLVAWIFVGVVAAPGVALAQERSDVGVTMGYPASIGVIWHVSERVAIRPELAFAHSSNESESSFSTTEGSSNSLGLGAAALFYVRKWDHVQTYVSPRYTYSRIRSETEQSALNESSRSETDTHSIAGYFGAQYSPHQRFSIFGEVGLGVTRSTGRLVEVGSESHTTVTSTRTGAGVIFYF